MFPVFKLVRLVCSAGAAYPVGIPLVRNTPRLLGRKDQSRTLSEPPQELPLTWPASAGSAISVAILTLRKALAWDRLRIVPSATVASMADGQSQTKESARVRMATGTRAAATTEADGATLLDDLESLRIQNELLRKKLQDMIDLVNRANSIINGLKEHRDELLDAIRWHRDMIQLPTKPDKRLWKNTVVKWDRDNR